MSTLAEIEQALDTLLADKPPVAEYADHMLEFGDTVVAHWNEAHGYTPTTDEREGFRLLALHRQGAKDNASFNACRETCRELVYHYNLLTQEPEHEQTAQRMDMMYFVAKHLFLFISGKLQEQQLGDFCCSSRPLRQNAG